MNPQRLYKELYYDALSKQIESDYYETFVAMPFRDQFSYNSTLIFEEIICKSAELANNQLISEQPRRFARPIRVDKLAPNASEITEEIVEGILNCHFFIGDFTLANHGVLLEAGIALAFKPSKYIVFLLQGDFSNIHFDIKDNRFISYDDKENATNEIANALIEGSKHFESLIGDQMIEVRKNLSPQAMHLLNLYGQLQLANPGNSLHFGQVVKDIELGDNESIRRVVFDYSIQELLLKNLIYLDYAVADDGIKPDRYGLHSTKFGRVFIKKTWPKSFDKL